MGGVLDIGVRILAGINTLSMEAPPEIQLDLGQTRGGRIANLTFSVPGFPPVNPHECDGRIANPTLSVTVFSWRFAVKNQKPPTENRDRQRWVRDPELPIRRQ
jgi:hypothetical protein